MQDLGEGLHRAPEEDPGCALLTPHGFSHLREAAVLDASELDDCAVVIGELRQGIADARGGLHAGRGA